ncbi:DUF3616 domain-containing protein [Variovorax robiniae]|uniref:DUF3616 domain-containing protein n=1 Tax=Variovorax robiniae TaxID=1836199 RepID=A0ABU8X8Z9_9BURK
MDQSIDAQKLRTTGRRRTRSLAQTRWQLTPNGAIPLPARRSRPEASSRSAGMACRCQPTVPVRPARRPRDVDFARVDNPAVQPSTAPGFLPMTGIYEPSAVQQLPDGRLLVVEDEKHHQFSLVTIAADGSIDSERLTPGLLHVFDDFWNLSDLEGLALDSAGFVYAITSHSRDDDGDEKKSRERLVRFRIDGSRVIDPKVFRGLKGALTAQFPLLAEAAGIRDVKNGGGLNIEGLEIHADEKRLMIGFRSPLHEGRAIIASVLNPNGIFADDEPPRLAAELDELDLDGHGIRALTWLPSLGDYLVISGPVSREPGEFALWRWNGRHEGPARRITIPGLQGLGRGEGVAPAVLDGVERIVIVSDDGNRKEERPAHYLLLDPGQLKTGR